MKIHLHVGGETATATLEDTPMARDFAALLPLTLTLTDYAGTERIAQLPRKLSKAAGAPSGLAPQAGDIAYYAPWGNLAVFIGPDAHDKGLERLGRIHANLPLLQRPGPYQVRIERAAD